MIEDLLQAAIQREDDGERFLSTRRTESFTRAFTRRLRLAWECVTLRPSDLFYDEFYPLRPFRRTEIRCESVWPGHPDYDKADRFAPGLYRKLLSESPWTTLAKGCGFPEGLGYTITQTPTEIERL